MASSLVQQLPTLAQVDRDLAERRREVRLLQSLREMLRRKEAKERAAERLQGEATR